MYRDLKEKVKCPECGSSRIFYGTRAVHYETKIQTTDFSCSNNHKWMKEEPYEALSKSGKVPPSTQSE